jgi:mannose/fructose/N-acetylgalactosamine-specific phosphotransferase system component IIC
VTPFELAALAALGAFLFIDQWPALQTMASRPVVAGVLVGVIVGRPSEGALWGAVFEAMYLGILPFGAARYSDAALATLAGTTVALMGREGHLYPAGLAVAAALAGGRIGEWTDHAQRKWNGGAAERARARVAAGDPDALSGAVAQALIRAVLLGGVQAAFVVAAAVALGQVAGAAPWTGPLAPRDLTVVALAAAAVGGGRLFGPRRFHGVRPAVIWGTGVLAGAGLALWSLEP